MENRDTDNTTKNNNQAMSYDDVLEQIDHLKDTNKIKMCLTLKVVGV
jgi:hypothetical protein